MLLFLEHSWRAQVVKGLSSDVSGFDPGSPRDFLRDFLRTEILNYNAISQISQKNVIIGLDPGSPRDFLRTDTQL